MGIELKGDKTMAGKKINARVENLDVAKLEKYLEVHNIAHTSLSADMGYDKTYLSGILRGKFIISLPAYKMMCMMLKVDEKTFLIEEAPTTPQMSQPIVMQGGITKEQFEMLLGAFNSQVEVLDRMAESLKAFAEAFGVKETPKDTSNPIKTLAAGEPFKVTIKK